MMLIFQRRKRHAVLTSSAVITATAFYSINDVMEKTIAEMDLMSETAVRFTSFLGYGDLMAENCEFFLPHSHLTPSLGVNPSNFWINFLSRKLESLGYQSVKIS